MEKVPGLLVKQHLQLSHSSRRTVQKAGSLATIGREAASRYILHRREVEVELLHNLVKAITDLVRYHNLATSCDPSGNVTRLRQWFIL